MQRKRKKCNNYGWIHPREWNYTKENENTKKCQKDMWRKSLNKKNAKKKKKNKKKEEEYFIIKLCI